MVIVEEAIAVNPKIIAKEIKNVIIYNIVGLEKTVFLFGSTVEVNRLRIVMGMLNILLDVLMKLEKDKLRIMIVVC